MSEPSPLGTVRAPFHVAVIGSGGWCKVHLRALQASPHVERVTICSRNTAAAQALATHYANVQSVTADYDRVLNDSSIALVHIVLPHHLHADWSIAALERGKHVICEKPAALSLDQFDRLCQAAATSQGRLLVVMNQLYNPVARHAQELVSAGRLGRVFLSLENAFRSHTPHYRDPAAWRTSLEQAGGGVLMDGAYHMVYRHLDTLADVGPPEWVMAETSQLNIDPRGQAVPDKGEDFMTVTVGLAGGARIAWVHGWLLEATPRRARQSFVAGSEGTLEFTDDAEWPLELGTPDGQYQRIAVAPGARTGVESTERCLADYLDCLAEQGQPLRASLALARQTLAVIGAIYESSRSGVRVRLDRYTNL